MMYVYRVLDANFNRAREGLRVIEEAARLVINDARLAGKLKEIRHRLTELQDLVPGNSELLRARDSVGDVGAGSALPAEMTRRDVIEIVSANVRRVQEAFRVLEEYVKILAPLGQDFKKLRFELYEVEKQLAERITGLLKPRIDVSLYVISGSKFSRGRSVVEVMAGAIRGGATTIQLREKEFSTKELIRVGLVLRELTRKHGVTFIVNDRVDVALAVDADGVHLGQDDLPVSEARRILGDHKIIGVSTHSIEQAIQAEREGADYIGVGPVYETRTKEDVCAAVGLELVREVSRLVKIPKVAIGGIVPHNAAAPLREGADGIAVITAVVAASDVTAAASELRGIVDRVRREG